MVTIAADLKLLTAGIAAEIAAILLSMRHPALARLMSTFPVFLLIHGLLRCQPRCRKVACGTRDKVREPQLYQTSRLVPA